MKFADVEISWAAFYQKPISYWKEFAEELGGILARNSYLVRIYVEGERQVWPRYEPPIIKNPDEWRKFYMSDPMTPEEKAWIDAASYEDLLRKWRFAPAGDPHFSGETAKYYVRRMQEKKPDNRTRVAISKKIGW